jgi:hypothetical protein
MADNSWIAPATKNLANLFGLNPEAAAKGRAMQSEQEYNAARTANTQADTGLSPYRQRLLEAQAQTQAAQAGKFGADTRFRDTETGGLAEQQRQLKIAQQFINDNFTMDASGRPVPKPGTLGQTMAAVIGAGGIQNVSKSPQVIGQFGLIAAPSSREANLAAGGPNATAAAKPTFAGTNEQAQAIIAQQQGADQARDIAVQQERNKGSLAEAFQKAGLPGAANAQANVDQIELNRQSDAIKAGAEWVMKVPIQGGFLDEGQAYQLSQAARAANPSLNPQDAITKFIRDNPGMMKQNWEMFGKNKVDIQGGIPATVPAAPAVRAPAANGFKGAPSMPMATDNQQPAAQAPAAPAGMPTKSQFAALPEGGSVMVGGVKYVKQGRQLVPAQ